MESFRVNDKVKYSGELNNWTFAEDLKTNCQGIVVSIINTNGEINYQVKFDNGITVSIEGKDLQVVI
jgi:hypothetical protein